MIHHERLRPPPHDYPADEWNIIERRFHPEFLAQLETMLSLGNGYLGIRGCPEEGGPNAENTTLINGFHETRPIVYGEEAYGFAKTGQTICNVTDSKIIKLFVDDEPFWLPKANILRYDRRLNMKAGTLDREILWETPAGKQVSATRLFRQQARCGHFLLCDGPQCRGLHRDLIGDGDERPKPSDQWGRPAANKSLFQPRIASANPLFEGPPHRTLPCHRKDPSHACVCH
jgi:hypothetical protein